MALIPTLTTIARLKHELAVASPNCSGRISHSPIAYEMTVNEKIVLAKSYSDQDSLRDGPQVGSSGRSVGGVHRGGRGRHRASCSGPAPVRRPAPTLAGS